jgi:hypothetical protein
VPIKIDIYEDTEDPYLVHCRIVDIALFRILRSLGHCRIVQDSAGQCRPVTENAGQHKTVQDSSDSAKQYRQVQVSAGQ